VVVEADFVRTALLALRGETIRMLALVSAQDAHRKRSERVTPVAK